MSNQNSIRINKYLSDRGPYSRRSVDNLINQKRILVNGKFIKPGFKVNSDDEIKIDGEIVNKSKKRKNIYLIFNKPVGIECTTNQKIKNNIIDYIGYPQRIFPIGRLDKDSEGLILLTNDGDIVNKILRSENNNEKEYVVQVNRKITSDFLSNMSKGVKLKNIKTKPCVIQKINNYTFKIILTQGLNRQIRRMCNLFDYKVKSLIRTRIMNIELGSIKAGRFRKILPNELEELNKILEKSF